MKAWKREQNELWWRNSPGHTPQSKVQETQRRLVGWGAARRMKQGGESRERREEGDSVREWRRAGTEKAEGQEAVHVVSFYSKWAGSPQMVLNWTEIKLPYCLNRITDFSGKKKLGGRQGKGTSLNTYHTGDSIAFVLCCDWKAI